MKFDPATWPALSHLLDQWLDLPPDSRSRWLDNLGPEYSHVLPQLRIVLASRAEAGDDFLRTLPKLDPAQEFPAATGFQPGAQVGPYRLIRLLGQGGMGVVWQADRADGTLKRPVALKLPNLSLRNAGLSERFARERDILAQLVHPHIARLYDAGSDDRGQPYLALEYVDGQTIIDYCDSRNAALKPRLLLFLDVLRAVQYAHANLIVHRDLKPSNILVTGEGQVRLLDFGIAKLLTDGEARETELTRIGGMALTPEYASPEQITGAPITTASDVYSLGVVLCQLLTGGRPYKLKRNTRNGLEEAILEAEPARPSQVAPSKRLSRSLQGDLDTIVLKALSKQPAQRYASADAFAQDIDRYLKGEPVLAQPESVWYRARKFVVRNTLAVGAAAAVLLALAAGLTVALWQANRAQTEAATSKALNEFLQNDLLAQASANQQSGPNVRPDPDLKVRDALDRAAARITGKFDSQPAVEASIRHTIGLTYRDLGLYPQAQQQLERALTLRRRVLGAEHVDTLSTMSELALLYISQGKHALAEPLLTNVLAAQRRLRGDQHPETLATMNDLAMVANARGDYPRAAMLFEGVLKTQRRVLGEEHREVLVVMNNLATTYLNQGKYTQAGELYEKAVELKRRTLGPEHPSTLASINNLAIIYRNQGNYNQAEALLTTLLATRQRVLGEQHPDTLATRSSLGLLYQAEGKYAQAEPLLIQVLDARRVLLGKDHSYTLASINNLAELYRNQGKNKDAESLFTQLLEARRRVLGPDHPNTLNTMSSLGGIELQQSNYAGAEALLRQALKGYEKANPDAWRGYYTRSMLGAALMGLRKNADAEPLLLSGHAGLLERRSSIPFENRSVLAETSEWIAQLHRASPQLAAEAPAR